MMLVAVRFFARFEVDELGNCEIFEGSAEEEDRAHKAIVLGSEVCWIRKFHRDMNKRKSDTGGSLCSFISGSITFSADSRYIVQYKY